MKIDFFAWGPQMVDHMAPIWHALPQEYRGRFFVRAAIRSQAAKHGIDAVSYRRNPMELAGGDGPVVVANPRSLHEAQRAGRDTIIMTHDAGDTLGNGKLIEPSYLRGGVVDRTTRLFLAPGEHIAEYWRAVYPDIPAEIIGCPKLDPWIREEREIRRRNDPPIVVISFTWDWMVNQDIRGAWSHYAQGVRRLAQDPRWRVIGHGHPRMIDHLVPHYRRMGIPIQRSFEWVMEHADLYVCDRSSTMYEFAAIGKPVVVLNAPWYRNVKGDYLRFWRAAHVGLNCNEPEDLPEIVARALEDPEEVRLRREDAVSLVYGVRDGTSAYVAANAILKVLGIEERVEPPPIGVGPEPVQISIKEESTMRMIPLKALKSFTTNLPLPVEGGVARKILRGQEFDAPEHLAMHYKRRRLAEASPTRKHSFGVKSEPDEAQVTPGPSETQVSPGPEEAKGPEPTESPEATPPKARFEAPSVSVDGLIKPVGGGWYEIPDGLGGYRRVRGKEAALEAASEIVLGAVRKDAEDAVHASF